MHHKPKIDLLLLLTFGGALSPAWASHLDLASSLPGWSKEDLANGLGQDLFSAALVTLVAFLVSFSFKDQWRFRIHVPLLLVYWSFLTLDHAHVIAHGSHLTWAELVDFWQGRSLASMLFGGKFFLMMILPLLIYVMLVVGFGAKNFLFAQKGGKAISLGIILALALLGLPSFAEHTEALISESGLCHLLRHL